jgi:DNA ligase-1
MSLAKRIKKDPKVTTNLALKRAVNSVIQSAREFEGPVLLAKTYFKNNGDIDQDPKGWWQSEKLDGYRAVWTGSKFVSRTGKEFNSPQWFKDIMPPKVALDGELWMGRQSFENTGGIRHKVPRDDVWIKVQYHVFDIPTITEAFEVRKDLIEVLTHHLVDTAHTLVQRNYPKVWELLKKAGNPDHWKPIMPVVHKKVSNKAQVLRDLDKIVAKGGEGLMLRKPGSMYEGKRSSTLLKVKKAFDTECTVVGYKPGAGKYTGKLGAFHCQLLSDHTIKFYLSGMTDKIRSNYKTSHPIGTILTFTYNETSKNGVPRFPRYQRIRTPE